MKVLSYRVNRLNRHTELARRCSNRELWKIAHLFGGDVVNVSAWKDADKEGWHYRDYFTKARSYTITNFPGYRGFQDEEGEILLDIEQETPESLRSKFDVVFNHTTLEHVFDCWQAFRCLAQMSRDILIVVVPFVQTSHDTDSFKDYWRFTPSALRSMYKHEGMTVVYEAINEQVDAASYLFFVGSYKPERYLDKMPPWEPLGPNLCTWIGTRRWFGPLTSLWIDRWSKLPSFAKYMWPEKKDMSQG